MCWVTLLLFQHANVLCACVHLIHCFPVEGHISLKNCYDYVVSSWALHLRISLTLWIVESALALDNRYVGFRGSYPGDSLLKEEIKSRLCFRYYHKVKWDCRPACGSSRSKGKACACGRRVSEIEGGSLWLCQQDSWCWWRCSMSALPW